MAPHPIATYRLQLRGGVDFAAATAMLPYLGDLGISHLYLSPIFSAQVGSTHGYDVTDPNTIDEHLGGWAGFETLAHAARDAGIAVILDIVPNHTAFSLENPMLRDVLRNGADSRFARHFDIDWSRPLVLPFLPEPFDAMLDAGKVRTGHQDGNPVLMVGDLAVPLAPGSAEVDGAEDLRSLHAAQAWRLTHWERERDSITHRRFFNITGLIGMRIEDQPVFEDLHRLTFELIDAGLVQGLRVDHVDGLADPAGYVARLRDRLGDVPIWVEKILTGDEVLPDWGIAGTTGYEAARQICRLLTDSKGHADIVARWREATGKTGSFHDAVINAKHEVIRQDLAAELHQLISLAGTATEEVGDEQGQEALREAIIALLIDFPRYRTYFTPRTASPEDVDLMQSVADRAAAGLRTDTALRLLQGFVTDPQSEAAAAFQCRFQQVTGALIAKSHEDTAAFRWNAYLAANEVGADPGDATTTATEMQDWLIRRGPQAMTLTSSHDTKRSEDARMRLAAISHRPGDFIDLVEIVAALPSAQQVGANTRWYLAQTVLAIWDPADPDISDRVCDHMLKALREKKIDTNWTHPDPEPEARATALARAVVAKFHADAPSALDRLIEQGERLSLIQTALKLTIPGVPDIYRGTEGPYLALTDPDNRRPVDMDALRALPEKEGFPGQKARLTRALLALRRAHPDFFEAAATTLDSNADGSLTLTRQDGDRRLTLQFYPTHDVALSGSVWPAEPARDGRAIAIEFG